MSTVVQAVTAGAAAAIYKKMPPPLQKVADSLKAARQKAETTGLHANYQIGAAANRVLANTKTYGEGAANQLADYLGVQKPMVYALAKVAEAFTMDEVLTGAAKAAAKGAVVSTAHWILLARVTQSADRQKMLRSVVDQRLSVTQLKDAILSAGGAKAQTPRNAGRTPNVPTDPIAQLNKLASKAMTLGKYAAEMDDDRLLRDIGLLDQSDDLKLVLEETLRTMKETQTEINKDVALLEKALGKGSKAVAKKPAAKKPKAEETASDEDAELASVLDETVEVEVETEGEGEGVDEPEEVELPESIIDDDFEVTPAEGVAESPVDEGDEIIDDGEEPVAVGKRTAAPVVRRR